MTISLRSIASLRTIAALLTAVLVLTTSCSGPAAAPAATGDGPFVIEGTVEHIDDIAFPAGAKIWLVPFFGPHPRPVDSCLVADDGTFRFEGCRQLLATVRLSAQARYGYQDLLVVTEPGTIHATIGAVSSGGGTPMNDALEDWKHHIEAYRSSLTSYYQVYRAGGFDSTTLRLKREALDAEAGGYVYDFLRRQGSNTLTRGLYTIRFGRLTPEQQAELDELLRDTTDYSLPQRGFR